MQEKSGTLVEWLIPLAFILCAGWLTWHLPVFTLSWFPPADASQYDKLSALFDRIDVTPGLAGLFGGYADMIDWGALLWLPVFGYLGLRTVRRAPMEYENWKPLDRLAVFVGHLTMILIVLLCCVIIYEVILCYIFETPTLWANELSLWLADFVFLCAGFYAMQQRSHIRIFLLYDMLPRALQRTCDCISTLLIVTFAFFLVYGGYGEAFDKFYRCETFGTALDPSIPATLKPMVLLVIVLVAFQAVVNLISDWHAEPVIHSAADDIDADEIERLKAVVSADNLDVTLGANQPNPPRNN